MTIRTRLAISNTAVIAVVTSVVAMSVYFFTSANLHSTLDKELTDRARPFESANLIPGWRPEAVRPRRTIPSGARELIVRLEEDLLFPRLIESGKVVSPGPRVPFDAGALSKDPGLSTVAYTAPSVGRTVMIRVLTKKVLTPEGKSLQIQFAASLEPINQELRQLSALLRSLFFFGLAAAAAGGWLLTKMALDPIGSLSLAARNLRKGDPRARLPAEGSDEISGLATTINEYLDEIESSYRRLEQFVADGSHELKSPLTVILLHSSKDSSSWDELRSDMDQVRRAANGMKKVVDDLLVIARSSEQDRQFFTYVQLNRIVGAAADQFDSSLGHRLVVNVEGNVQILGDPTLLLRLVSNMLQNALVHAGANACVNVRLRSIGEAAVLTVQDNGQGIPAGDLPHVFERFYRADRARTHGTDWGGGGSGLGLAIVKAVAELHGGQAKVESGEGQGTTVTVEIPLFGCPSGN